MGNPAITIITRTKIFHNFVVSPIFPRILTRREERRGIQEQCEVEVDDKNHSCIFVDCTRSKQWAHSNLTTCNFDILQDLSLPAQASIQWWAESYPEQVLMLIWRRTAGGDIPSQSQHWIIVTRTTASTFIILSTVSPLSQIIKFKSTAQL